MIDSHAHLTSSQILPQVDDLVDRAKEAGVKTIINICTDQPSLEEGLKLAKRNKNIFNAAATTPHDVQEDGETFFPIVERVVDKLIAIGETGLDYFYEHSPKKVQQDFLVRYLQLALHTKLPIIFHCRDAFGDLFSIADEMAQDLPAVLHCFTGTKEEAKGCLDRGWFVSFSGIITFKKSEELREVVRYVPLNRMFVETDTPYLAPQSHRGKQNEPAFVVEIAEKIAEIKGISLSEVDKIVSENISRFFRLEAIG